MVQSDYSRSAVLHKVLNESQKKKLVACTAKNIVFILRVSIKAIRRFAFPISKCHLYRLYGGIVVSAELRRRSICIQIS